MEINDEKKLGGPSARKEKAPNRPLLGKLVAWLGVLFSIVFLLNLSAGFIEIPDNLIFVGNLDEVAVSGFLFGCLNYLGIELIPFGKRRREKSRVKGKLEDGAEEE